MRQTVGGRLAVRTSRLLFMSGRRATPKSLATANRPERGTPGSAPSSSARSPRERTGSGSCVFRLVNNLIKKSGPRVEEKDYARGGGGLWNLYCIVV